MKVTFDDCNSTEEICGLFNKVFANQGQMEAKIVQNAQKIEALKPKEEPKTEPKTEPKPKPKAKPKPKPKPKPKGKNKMKSKGSASMRVIAILMLIAAVAGLGYAAYVPNDINYEIASNPELLSTYLRDVTGTMISDSYLFTPRLGTNPPQLADGRVWYNNTANRLQISLDGTTWTSIDVAGGNSLDAAYDLSEEITVDSGTAVTFTSPDNSGNQCLLLTQSDVTNDGDALSIANAANAGTAVSIDIDGTAGYDIQGTGDTWEVSVAGIGDFTGLIVGGTDIVMENSGVINNTTNNEIEFIENSEEFSFAFNGNTLTMATDTGIDTWEFGVIDDVNGIETIVFDNAACSITLDGNTDGHDFTIAHTADAGTDNSSIILDSAGTGDDAIDLVSSVGGVDIDAVKSVTITSTENTTDSIVINATLGGVQILADAAGATEDILIANTGGSVHITASEDTTDAFNLDVTGTDGGIDLDTTDGPITLTTAGAANGDMTLTVADAFTLTSTDTAQNGIHIEANGGTAESINLYSNQGTGASATTQHDASIQLQSDAGGISLYTTGNVADAIRIEANAGGNETITVQSVQGTGVGSILVDSTLGGIKIAAHAASKDIDIDSVLGSIFLEAEEDSATAISIIADGSTASGVWIQSETGTSVTEDTAAVEIRATVGGINIQSDANLDDAIMIRVDGGTTSEMILHNDTGNTATSIELVSDVGGITLNGAVGGVVFTAGQTRHYVIRVNDIDLDGTNPPGLSSLGTDAQWRSDVLQFDSDPGGNDDVCYIPRHVPAGYIADSADLHVYWTYSDAEDAADECTIDGTVDAVGANETTDAAGTGMAAVASVITDASASAGKLQKTSLDIEVEDIAVDDMVTILFFFDESECLMATSGTADVHYFVITWESTE